MSNYNIATVMVATQSINWQQIDLADIKGFEYAKRALEVALVGNHSIGLIGNNVGMKALFTALANNLGLTIFTANPCPCGNYGSFNVACMCDSESVNNFQSRDTNYQLASRADIVLKTIVEETNHLLSQRRGETSEEIEWRAEEAKRIVVSPALDQSCVHLLKACINTMGIDQVEVQQIVSVAKSIAALFGHNSLQAHYIAEAMQYRGNRR